MNRSQPKKVGTENTIRYFDLRCTFCYTDVAGSEIQIFMRKQKVYVGKDSTLKVGKIQNEITSDNSTFIKRLHKTEAIE